jgi:hypothetical protein
VRTDANELTHCTSQDKFPCTSQACPEADLFIDGQHEAGRAGRLDHALRVFEPGGDGFLREHVTARAKCREGRFRVCPVRRTDVDGLHRPVIQDIRQTLIDRRTRRCELRCDLPRTVEVEITDRDDARQRSKPRIDWHAYQPRHRAAANDGNPEHAAHAGLG